MWSYIQNLVAKNNLTVLENLKPKDEVKVAENQKKDIVEKKEIKTAQYIKTIVPAQLQEWWFKLGCGKGQDDVDAWFGKGVECIYMVE
jgi:hypothetical protein